MYYVYNPFKFLLFDDAFLYENLLQDDNSLLHLLLGMGSHQCKTHQCILRSTCWRNDGIDKHATVICLLGYKECLVGVTHIKRNDGAFRLTYLETFLAETLQRIVGNIPEVCETLRLVLYDVKASSAAAVAAGVLDALKM